MKYFLADLKPYLCNNLFFDSLNIFVNSRVWKLILNSLQM